MRVSVSSRVLVHTMALFAALLICGCGGSGSSGAFTGSYKSLQSGSTQAQVRHALGAPDWKLTTRVGAARHIGDPRSKLVGALPNGTPYEVWRYTRGNTEYRLYFSSATSGTPPDDWRLIKREAVPLNVSQP